MDAEALQAFLAKPHDAIISTNREGKGSQLSPVWFLWDGGAVLFSTRRSNVKYANIMRDPHISIIVNDPATHTYVTAYGRAEIVGVDRYPDLWDAISDKYVPADQRQQFTESNQTLEQASRAVIVLRPEKVISRSWNAG